MSATIYVLHGADSYSRKQRLARLREQIGLSEVVDANTLTLNGASLSPVTLQEAVSVVPFLADHRLVVVEGLLATREGAQAARGRGRAQRRATDSADLWQVLPQVLQQAAPTTLLVFLEDVAIRPANPLLQALRPLATVEEFRTPEKDDLRRWIQRKAAELGATLTPRAMALLAEMAGGDLWVLSNELEKLALYAAGRAIEEQDVTELVANTRERTIFQMVDAVLAGRSSVALQITDRLHKGGTDTGEFFRMLTRQLRFVLVAQELLTVRIDQNEFVARVGLPGAWAARPVMEQARRYPFSQLMQMYRAVLHADLAIKRGVLDERLALEILVADMSQAAARNAASRGGFR